MYQIKDDNLIITIPLTTTRSNPYDEECSAEMPNICGLVDVEQSRCGFGFWIDMEYKGKSDQNTDIVFEWTNSQEAFEEIKASEVVVRYKKIQDEQENTAF